MKKRRKPRITRHGLGSAIRPRLGLGASPLLVDALVQSRGRNTWTA